MEGGVLSPFGHQQDLLAMDLDVDDLLFEGCWLETTDGSDFMYQCPLVSNGFFELSDVWPLSVTNDGSESSCLTQKNDAEEGHCLVKTSPQTEIMPRSVFDNQNLRHINGDGYSVQSDKYLSENFELNRSWWIEPRANPGPATSVTQRLMTALTNIREFTKHKDVLIQIWVPINRGDMRVLTTNKQPFSLMDPNCPRLKSYRNISVNYQFSAEENSKDLAGLPGRVFLEKVPEWTPDVRFFSSYWAFLELTRLECCSKLVSGLESSDGCKLSKKRKYNSVPGTPNGVMDISFSSDSSNDSWSVSSSPEPLPKKNRVEDDQLVQKLKHAATDVLKIQR